MRSKTQSAFTIVELMVVVGLITIAVAATATWANRRHALRNAQLAFQTAAALDQAQIKYLADHPGGSLLDSDADSTIRSYIAGNYSMMIDTSAAQAADLATLNRITYLVSTRPATVALDGKNYSYPGNLSLK